MFSVRAFLCVVPCCCVHLKAPLKSQKIAHEFGFFKKKCFIYFFFSSFNIERLGGCSDRDVQQCPCWLMGYSERLDQQRGTMLNLCWQELSNTPPFREFINTFFLNYFISPPSSVCTRLIAESKQSWTKIFYWRSESTNRLILLYAISDGVFFVSFMALFLFLLSIIYSWVNNKALLAFLNSEGHVVFIGFVGSRQPVL